MDNAWDCEAMGLMLQGGERVVMVLRVTANGDPVAGTATGIDPTRLVCRNNTSGQTVRQPLFNNLDWNCSAAGLTVNRGDRLTIRIRGNVLK